MAAQSVLPPNDIKITVMERLEILIGGFHVLS
jgi:hypothetical protein